MKLYRVNNDSLRCILSSEDLERYNIGLQDFISQTNAADSFIRGLMQKAEEEIGFQYTHGMLSLRVMEMPDHNLCITISDTPVQSIRDQVMNSINDLLSSIGGSIRGQRAFEIDPEIEENTSSAASGSDIAAFPDEVLINFANVDDAVNYAARIKYKRTIASEFYFMKGSGYYLALHKGKMAVDSYERVVSLASEFCREIRPYANRGAVLKEHGEVLIKEKAVSALKKI